MLAANLDIINNKCADQTALSDKHILQVSDFFPSFPTHSKISISLNTSEVWVFGSPAVERASCIIATKNNVMQEEQITNQVPFTSMIYYVSKTRGLI